VPVTTEGRIIGMMLMERSEHRSGHFNQRRKEMFSN
jgi:hypothetical protein